MDVWINADIIKEINMPRKIIIVRHGETDWNRERAMQGHQDVPLNWQGLLQAKEAAEKLRHESFDAIFSSDLKRAHQTAMVIAAHHNQEILTTPLLRERYFGELEGMAFGIPTKLVPWITAREEFYARLHTTSWIHREFKIETNEEIEKRIKKFQKEHLQKFKNKNVLLVAHGGLMGLLLVILGVDLEFVKGKNIQNAEIFILKKEKGRYQLGNLGNKGV